MTMTASAESLRCPPLDLGRVSTVALLVGVAAFAGALAWGAIGGFARFFQAYLSAYLVFVGLTLGCIALGLLYQLVGGRWGEVLRPLLEAGRGAVPLMALLLLPIILGLRFIYPWAQDEGFLKMNHLLEHQHKVWSNPTSFILRAIAYFVIWWLMAQMLNRWGRKNLTLLLAGGKPRRLRGVSGIAMVLFFVTATLAAVDWAMSVQAGWYSTIYGLSFLASLALSALAFTTAAITFISRRGVRDEPGRDPPASTPKPSDAALPHAHEQSEDAPAHADFASAGALTPEDCGDLGNLLLTFVILWAYLNFSPYLIIWSGNIPHETAFYIPRTTGGWQWVALALVVCQFAVPFFLLLMRDVKRDPSRLGLLALGILAARYLDWFWQIQPSFARQSGVRVNIQHLLTPLAVGGIWLGFVARQLKGRHLMPAPAEGGSHG